MVYFMLHPTHSLSTITTIRIMAAKHVDSHDGCDVMRVCGMKHNHTKNSCTCNKHWLIVIEVCIYYTHIITEVAAPQCYTIQEF